MGVEQRDLFGTEVVFPWGIHVAINRRVCTKPNGGFSNGYFHSINIDYHYSNNNRHKWNGIFVPLARMQDKHKTIC